MEAKKLIDHLTYCSYRSNRDEGMTHEQLISIGVGNKEMKEKYEKDNAAQTSKKHLKIIQKSWN